MIKKLRNQPYAPKWEQEEKKIQRHFVNNIHPLSSIEEG
jgi:hypothetical protein